MQAAKKAVESIKETAANVGASAKSGLEKTKAIVEEKSERMTAHDSIEKEMASERKEERVRQAEREKLEAREHNAAAKMSATSGHMGHGRYTTSGFGSGIESEPITYSSTEIGSRSNDQVMGSDMSGTNSGMGGRNIAYDANVGGTTTGTRGGDFN